MIPLTALPALNAVLNGTSAILLAAGYVAIRRRRVRVHRACMVAAFTPPSSSSPPTSPTTSRWGPRASPGTAGCDPSTSRSSGTHTLLAALIPPLALVTLTLALRARFARHARLARWTLPIWFYVSVTGVVIYVMLYHLYAA